MGKSKAQLEAELRVLKRSRTAEGIISTIQATIKYGAIVWISYYAYLSISDLAGKRTFADIGLNFLANFKVTVVLAWIVGIVGIVYGKAQNKLRKDTVERLQSRIALLEGKIDPSRSSSKLTTRGETNPEDRL